MQDRSAGPQRVLHIEDGGQLLVPDVDGAHRLLRDLARIGRDRRDAIADEEHAIPAEHRPVLQPAPEPLAAHVRAGQHSAHAGHGASAADLDGHDARVRIGAADERGLQRARDVDVGGVQRRARRLRVAVDTALGPIEQVGAIFGRHPAAIVARRQSANPARTLPACRAMSAWPSSPMRPRIATSLETRSSVGSSPDTARSTNARTAPPIR